MLNCKLMQKSKSHQSSPQHKKVIKAEPVNNYNMSCNSVVVVGSMPIATPEENTQQPYQNNYLTNQSQSFLKRITICSAKTMKHGKGQGIRPI